MIVGEIANRLNVPPDKLEECRVTILRHVEQAKRRISTRGKVDQPGAIKEISAPSAQPPSSFRNSREDRL
jgi:hypothetical protein